MKESTIAAIVFLVFGVIAAVTIVYMRSHAKASLPSTSLDAGAR